MRKELILLGAMLIIGAALPTAAAHWDWTNNGPDCNNTNFDERDPFLPGPKDTCGVAGRTVGVAGPAVVDTGGNVATGAGLISCDLEAGGSNVASMETEVDENPTSGSLPDNTFDDGGTAGACHISTYTRKDFNTGGCGETPDHGYAYANPTGASVTGVFISTGCDLGTTTGGGLNPSGVFSAAVCVVNLVLAGTPGSLVSCLTPLTTPTTGFANCQQDGTTDDGNFGYADVAKPNGVPVPTKTETQNTAGGGLDCSGTDASTSIFVFETLDLRRGTVSQPADFVWTQGTR